MGPWSRGGTTGRALDGAWPSVGSPVGTGWSGTQTRLLPVLLTEEALGRGIWQLFCTFTAVLKLKVDSKQGAVPWTQACLWLAGLKEGACPHPKSDPCGVSLRPLCPAAGQLPGTGWPTVGSAAHDRGARGPAANLSVGSHPPTSRLSLGFALFPPNLLILDLNGFKGFFSEQNVGSGCSPPGAARAFPSPLPRCYLTSL